MLEGNKFMIIATQVLLVAYALNNLIPALYPDNFDIRAEDIAEYSIHSSRGFFIAFHVWGVIIPLALALGVRLRHKILFLISLLLMIFHIAYPLLTS